MELKNFFAQDDQGNLLGGATCYLYERGTENIVAGLQAANGTALENPFTADANGLIQFAAKNGMYDLRVVSGARDYRINVQCNGVDENIQSADLANASEPDKGSSKVGFYDRLAPAYLKTVSDIINGIQVSLLRFIPTELHIAIRDNTISETLTQYIQDGLDAVRGPGIVTAKSIRSLYAPAGSYPTGTIFVHEGTNFYGDWNIETTAKNSTKLIQAEEGDVIRVIGHDVDSRKFWFGRIACMTIFGDQSLSNGIGLNFRDSDANAVSLQDSSYIHDITVRGMPESGIALPDGGLPVYIDRCKLFWNNAPGLHITGGTFAHQAIHLQGISGDGNRGGCIKLSNLDSAGNVLITNIKSEMRTNPYTGLDEQDNCIVIDNCSAGSAITVIGGTHISSSVDGAAHKKPGDFIKITGANIPHLDWQGIEIRVRQDDTGDEPAVVRHDTSAITVPRAVKSGKLSNSPRVDRTSNNAVFRVFGTADSYKSRSIEAPGDQIAGATPGRTLHETDAGSDFKTWLEVASGGSYSLRTVTDAGVATKVFEVIRNGGSPLRMDFLTPLRTMVYTIATLPAPTASLDNTIAMVSNPAPGKGRAVYCTATSWKYVSDDSTVV